MKLLDIKDEDIVNYKQISMFVALPYCSGKCWKELGLDCSICQNNELRKNPIIEVSNEQLYNRYISNPLTECIVFGGLEPLDSFDELYSFLSYLRKDKKDNSKIIIYTGYNLNEKPVKDFISKVIEDDISNNIILKVGRYIPNRPHVFNKTLGVELASDNQNTVEL